MKRWTWIMALMLALMIPLQGCTSDTPKDEGEEQNQQEQQEEELEQEEDKEPEEEKEPEDTQAPADEPENSDGDAPVSNQGQNNTSSENTSASVQKPQGGGSSSSQGSSQPSQGGGTQPQQPQQPQQPEKPDEKPQPALTASQVVSNLLGQHSMGDLADYNGMVGTLYGGIDLSQMESYCIKGPAMGTTATEIAVFQVKDGGSTASVEKALRQRADDIARTFEQYDPEQYEIAKKAVVRTEGNYVCMVIGSNASAVASSFEKLV